ncbi:TPA: hypothetical protein N6033_004855 [Escherichia coli]|nr:hypothetical protein [Escherichia coli]
MSGHSFLSEYMREYKNDYILIGGNACVLNFKHVGIEFRATSDLDIVLVIEKDNPAFYEHLCNYLITNEYKGGLYSCVNKQGGSYRFLLPKSKKGSGLPEQIELFSKKPDYFDPEKSKSLHITPIETADGISNFSAILMDELVYDFVIANKIELDNISTVNLQCLIGLKSIAWNSNEKLHQSGFVKWSDVVKHAGDIVRISTIIEDGDYVYPDSIYDSLQESKEKFILGDIAKDIPDISDDIPVAIDFISTHVKK